MAEIVFQDTIELRNEIIRTCLFLRDIGFCIGTWGNISVRMNDGIMITPSRMDYSEMKAEDLVIVSWTGKTLKGNRVPSSETALHMAILKHRPDLGAVVHSHSPLASVLACAHRDLPVCIEDMAQIIGGKVNCASYVPGGRHQALADNAVQAMGKNATAVLLANHGPVVGGRNLAEATVASQILEKAAGLFLRAECLGKCIAIPDEMVDEERNRFLYKYGREYPVEVKE